MAGETGNKTNSAKLNLSLGWAWQYEVQNANTDRLKKVCSDIHAKSSEWKQKSNIECN